MSLYLIAAIARDGAIGVTLDGTPGLPWPRLRRDLQWFKALTMASDPLDLAAFILTIGLDAAENMPVANAVIMGRKTWESLGSKELPNRRNIVISTTHPVNWLPPDTLFASQLCHAIDLAEVLQTPHTFVIGGARPFAEALRHPALEALFLTEVDEEYPDADTHWPAAVDPLAWSLGEMTDGTPGSCWHRAACSQWLEEAGCPRYRLGMWKREQQSSLPSHDVSQEPTVKCSREACSWQGTEEEAFYGEFCPGCMTRIDSIPTKEETL
jgi:dihydrofolate reductase